MKQMTSADWRVLHQASSGEIPPLTVAEMAKVIHRSPSTVRRILRATRGKTAIQILAEGNEVIAQLERDGL